MDNTTELVASFVLSYDYATDLMIEYMLNKNDKVKDIIIKLMSIIDYIIKISITINMPIDIILNMIKGNELLSHYLN